MTLKAYVHTAEHGEDCVEITFAESPEALVEMTGLDLEDLNPRHAPALDQYAGSYVPAQAALEAGAYTSMECRWCNHQISIHGCDVDCDEDGPVFQGPDIYCSSVCAEADGDWRAYVAELKPSLEAQAREVVAKLGDGTAEVVRVQVSVMSRKDGDWRVYTDMKVPGCLGHVRFDLPSRLCWPEKRDEAVFRAWLEKT